MYLERKIDKYLTDWKNSPDRKPLIVKGARQVGKTESINRFAEKNYKNVVRINFVSEPKYKTIIESGYECESIVKNITRIDPSKKFVEEDTLIFFDEIQDFPEIATSLKFFKIDGKYDVICSGSLLGVNYKHIESNSVGYKTDYHMYSLDFEEFLWANGYEKDIKDDILTHMKKLIPFSNTELNVLFELFLDYIILGGMPDVVKQYIINNSFEGSLQTQRQLLIDYEGDIRKYLHGVEQTRVLNVYRSIPVQLAKENKKFQISKVSSGARLKDYVGCIDWLKDAGIINICYCMNYPELPLKGNYNDSKFKIYIADTGLFVANLDDYAQDDLRVNKNIGVYKGALYENIVGEALVKSGCDLFYYKREDSTLEEDFFLRTKDNLVPIEVKATNNKSKSLNILIDEDKYSDIKFGVKLCKGNIGFENNIYTFPYFCAFAINEFLKDL